MRKGKEGDVGNLMRRKRKAYSTEERRGVAGRGMDNELEATRERTALSVTMEEWEQKKVKKTGKNK